MFTARGPPPLGKVADGLNEPRHGDERDLHFIYRMVVMVILRHVVHWIYKYTVKVDWSDSLRFSGFYLQCVAFKGNKVLLL